MVGSRKVLLYKLIIRKHDLLKSASLFWGHAFYKSTHNNAGKRKILCKFLNLNFSSCKQEVVGWCNGAG